MVIVAVPTPTENEPTTPVWRRIPESFGSVVSRSVRAFLDRHARSVGDY